MLIQDGKLRHTNKAVVIQIPSHKHLCSHEHELIVMTHKAQTLDTLDVAGANQAAVEGVVVADQIPKARIAVTVLVKQAVEHAAQRGTRRRGGIGSRTADASATKAAKLTRISIVAGAVRGRMSKGHSHRHAGTCTASSVSALPQQHQQTHEAEKEERCGPLSPPGPLDGAALAGQELASLQAEAYACHMMHTAADIHSCPCRCVRSPH